MRINDENIAIQKVHWGGENRFMLVSLPDRQQSKGPSMLTSAAMTKEEITMLLRDRGMQDGEIQRLMTAAEGQDV